uniref:ATP-dependent RNA helicase n=1 Tax=Panagrellus redivivus TaxID=6233 RepID=A0A7E4ZTF8_PANRE
MNMAETKVTAGTGRRETQNYNRRGGGFNGSRDGQDQRFEDYEKRNGRNNSCDYGNFCRGGYTNGGGNSYGLPRDSYKALHDNCNDRNGDYDDLRKCFNDPRSGFDNREPPSNHYNNCRQPNDYRGCWCDNFHIRHDNYRPPMSQSHQDSIGSNQHYNCLRTAGNRGVNVCNASQNTTFDVEAVCIVRCEIWNDIKLHPEVFDKIKLSGWGHPFEIQQTIVPCIMNDHDIMCQGETGNGKTMAFLIPTISKFLRDKESAAWKFTNRPYCIIITPTQKHCIQLYEQAKKFANFFGIRVERAYGEICIHENAEQVAKCDILIGCVGRLFHLMKSCELVASDVKILIIDDADRLFNRHDNPMFYAMFPYISRKILETCGTDINGLSPRFIAYAECEGLAVLSQVSKPLSLYIK